MIKLLTFCVLGTSLAAAAAEPPPHFVLIVSDDQDWNGLSVQLHPDMPNSKSD